MIKELVWLYHVNAYVNTHRVNRVVRLEKLEKLSGKAYLLFGEEEKQYHNEDLMCVCGPTVHLLPLGDLTLGFDLAHFVLLSS